MRTMFDRWCRCFRIIIGFCTLVSLFSCGGGLLGDIDDDAGDQSAEPIIKLALHETGSEIASGSTVPIDDTFVSYTKQTSFLISNLGDGALVLSSLGVSDTAGAYTLALPPSSPVSPGGQTIFTIEFAPDAVGEHDALVSISCNDPDDPVISFTINSSALVPPPPGTPGSLTATSGTSTEGIELAWDEVPDAELYVIYKSSAAGEPSDENDYEFLTGELSYTDTETIPGQIYYYYLKTWSSSYDFSTNFSDEVTGYRYLPRPVFDDQDGAHSGDDTARVLVEWTPVQFDGSDAPGVEYRVFRNTTQSESGASVFSATGSSFADTSAVPGTQYYYSVKSYHPSSDSYSNITAWCGGFRALSAPVNVVASRGTDADQISVTWDSVEGSVSSYILFKSTNSTWEVSDYRTSVSGTSGTFTDWTDDYYQSANTDDINAERMFTFFVKAVSEDTGSESALSIGASGFLRPTTPAPYAKWTASLFPHFELESDPWHDNQDRIHVYRSTTAGGTYADVTSQCNPDSYVYAPYTYRYWYYDEDPSIIGGNYYYYKLRYRSEVMTSVYSDYSPALEVPKRLAAPADFQLSKTGSSLNTSWNSVPNTDFYAVVVTVVFGSVSAPNYNTIEYTTTNTSYTHDCSGDHGTTYEYRAYVRACKTVDPDEGLQSNPSDYLSVPN